MSFPENIKDFYKSREIMREVQGTSRLVSPQTYARKIIASPTNNEVDCAANHLHQFAAPVVASTVGIMRLMNMSEGQSISIAIASSGFNYTLTWIDDISAAVKWPPTGVPIPTSIAARYDVYTFMKVGGLIFGSAILQMG